VYRFVRFQYVERLSALRDRSEERRSLALPKDSAKVLAADCSNGATYSIGASVVAIGYL